jgi:hypothetical protein
MNERQAPTSNVQTMDSSAQPDQVANSYADRLIDDLFDGVERALQGDVEALDEPRRTDDGLLSESELATDDVPEMTLNFAEGGLPTVLMGSESGDLDVALPTDLSEVAMSPSDSTAEASAQPPSLQRFWTVNRALLGAAGFTLFATLGLWVYQQQTQPPVATDSLPVPTDAPVANPDAEFLSYLQRSLDVIAQTAVDSSGTAETGVSDVAIALNNGSAALPPMAGAPLPAQPGMPAAAGSLNVIERVYIPYPSAQSADTAPANPTVINGGVSSSPATTAASPMIVHTLVGVLELGDRSAALFEIDGTPQRVYIGERIGGSGWSLVSVANEEATIRRNGEVRTLYIGQQF